MTPLSSDGTSAGSSQGHQRQRRVDGDAGLSMGQRQQNLAAINQSCPDDQHIGLVSSRHPRNDAVEAKTVGGRHGCECWCLVLP